LTGEFSFEKVYSASVSCLTWTVTGLYACFAEAHPDLPHAFSIGLARDPAFTMDTVGPFEPLLKYSDALGPPACASAECGEHWTTDTCVSLQAQCDSVGSAADFGCSEAGIAGAGNGGAPVTDPTPARPNDDAEPAGCACTTARVPLNAGHAVAVGIAALAAAWRRRRHQRVSFCA
jgi:MYXO-CTERM domain-containing protein